jgi:hypothetical protein
MKWGLKGEGNSSSSVNCMPAYSQLVRAQKSINKTLKSLSKMYPLTL